MKNLIAVFLVALAFGACTPVAAVVQPTPQIVYVTPAPTAAPTPTPTLRPTPEPTEASEAFDPRYLALLDHLATEIPRGGAFLTDFDVALDAADWGRMKSALQGFIDWSVNEGVYTTEVDVPDCAKPLVSAWYTVVSNYGAGALGLQDFMESGSDSSLTAGFELMRRASDAVDTLPFGGCSGGSSATFSS